jgi:hypothetical protein
MDPRDVADVHERVGVQEHEVGDLSRRDAPERVGGVEKPRRVIVAARSASSGVSPASTKSASSSCRLVPGTRSGLPMSVPASNGTPARCRLVSAVLYGVEPSDPRAMLLAACTLLIVAGVAALVPAWRAARVDPNVALRAD